MSGVDRRARRGSDTSDKQIYRAVKDGRLITFHVFADLTVRGYVYGMDDYHWAVVTADTQTWMVHKSAPAVQVSAASSLEEEPNREAIEAIVSPYRNRVLSEHFGRTQPAIAKGA